MVMFKLFPPDAIVLDPIIELFASAIVVRRLPLAGACRLDVMASAKYCTASLKLIMIVRDNIRSRFFCE